MIVYRAFFKILKKNGFQILLYFFIFMALSIFFMTTGNDEAYKLNSIYRLGIINRDDAGSGVDLESYLGRVFKTKHLKDDLDVAKNAVFSFTLDYVLLIDEDGKLYSYARDDNAAAIAVNMRINEFMNASNAVSKLKMDLDNEALVNILTDNVPVELSNQNGRGVTKAENIENYYKYSGYTLMGMIMTGIFIGYKNFKDPKIRIRMAMSGTPIASIQYKLLIGSLSFVVFVWFLFNLFGLLMIGSELLKPRGLLILLNTLVYCVPVTALGFLMSMITSNQVALNAAANVMSMTLSFISGVFVPREFVHPALLKLSTLFPTYWMLIANENIIVNEINYNVLFKSYGIMLLIASGLFALTMILAKFNDTRGKQSVS